jgi:transposase
MLALTEQRLCIKCCFKLGKTFTETSEMLKKVFHDKTMSRMTTYEWYRRFKGNRSLTEDDPRSGRHTNSTDADSIKRVQAVTRSNQRLTVWEVADERGISVALCKTILTEKLHMHRFEAKFVLRLLTKEQKEQCVCNLSRTSPSSK